MTMRSLIMGALVLFPALMSAVTEQECQEDILFKFFPKGFVLEVLGKYNVPQDKANAIADSLYQADQQVVMIIGQKASTMNPNPLEDIKADKERAQLFRESLTEVFTGVMSENGINDTQQIQQMLDEIQKLRMERFDQCHKEGLVPRMRDVQQRNQ